MEKSRARHGKLIDKLRGKLMEGGFLDDTHDKVYELNRQMCDLDIPLRDPIKPLSEETAQELIGRWEEIGKEWASKKKKIVESIFGNITNEKSNIMEEKKTKKMTKAEAFEYLKGKKVKCYKVGEHYGEELLKKLTECGCTSNIFLPKGILSIWAIFISDVCDLSILDTAHADQYGNYDLCEISADDILSIEIVEECAKDDEDPYFGGRIKDLQEMLEDDEVLIITKTNFLTMTK